jgi:hypothetical protein
MKKRPVTSLASMRSATPLPADFLSFAALAIFAHM